MTQSEASQVDLAERLKLAADHLDRHAKVMWDARSRDFANDCRLAAERLKELAQGPMNRNDQSHHVERAETRDSGD